MFSSRPVPRFASFPMLVDLLKIIEAQITSSGHPPISKSQSINGIPRKCNKRPFHPHAGCLVTISPIFCASTASQFKKIFRAIPVCCLNCKIFVSSNDAKRVVSNFENDSNGLRFEQSSKTCLPPTSGLADSIAT